MRKFRNARSAPVPARRPDGMPNRAMHRSMSPVAQMLDARHVQGLWFAIAAALIPGYVPKEN